MALETSPRHHSRLNGFSSPYHPFQLASYVVFGVCVIGSIIICLNSGGYGNIVWPVLIAIYMILAVATFSTGWFATASNAIDPMLVQSRTGEVQPIYANYEIYRTQAVQLGWNWCMYCGGYVHARSKHSRASEKCIADFDHVCIYLNNDIGGKNYRLFATLIVLLLALLLLQLGIAVYVATKCFSDNGLLNRHVSAVWGSTNAKAILAVALFEGIIALLVLVPLVHLAAFHVWINIKHINTYDYIMQQRNRRQNHNIRGTSKVIPQGATPFSNTPMSFISFQQQPQETKLFSTPNTSINNVNVELATSHNHRIARQHDLVLKEHHLKVNTKTLGSISPASQSASNLPSQESVKRLHIKISANNEQRRQMDLPSNRFSRTPSNATDKGSDRISANNKQQQHSSLLSTSPNNIVLPPLPYQKWTIADH